MFLSDTRAWDNITLYWFLYIMPPPRRLGWFFSIKKPTFYICRKHLMLKLLFLSDHPLVVSKDGCIGELPDRHQLPIGVEGPHSQTAEPAVLLQRQGFNIWKLTPGSKVTFSHSRPVMSKSCLMHNYSYLCLTFFSFIYEYLNLKH